MGPVILLLFACAAEDEPTRRDLSPAEPESVEEAEPTPEWFRDADGDTYGDAYATAAPDTPGYVPRPDDCDDTDPSVHPAAAEVGCDLVDNDCDGAADDDLGGYCLFADADLDGWGDAAHAVVSATSTAAGVSDQAGDCDDADPSVFPGAEDRCFDGADDDCDGFDCGSDLQAPYGATSIVEGPIGFGYHLSRVGDVDGDGVDDVWATQRGHLGLVSYSDGWPETTYSEEPWGAYLVSAGADHLGPFVESPQHVFAEDAWDSDGDGGGDLWVWEPNRLATRVGSAAFLAGTPAAQAQIAISPDRLREVAALDEDDATVAVMGWDTLYVFPDDGPAGTRGPADARTTVATGHHHHVWLVDPGDLDGDGREDLLLKSIDALLWAPDLPSGALAAEDLGVVPWCASGGGGSRLSPVGDIDGDGLRDFAHNGCVHAGGPHAWSEPHATGRYGLDEAGDVNGDGFTDVLYGQGVAFGPISGGIWDAERVGIAPVVEGTGYERLEAGWMPLLGIGDVDGDGHDDLYTSSPALSGTLWSSDHVRLGGVSEGPGRLWLIPGYAIR